MGRIDPVSLRIRSLQIGPPILLPREIGPLLPCPPIVQLTRPEALRKTIAVRAAAIARWVDMNPAEMRGHPATADKPASRGTRNLLVDVEMVLAAVMRKVAAVETEAEVEIEAAEGTAGAAAGIVAAKRKVDEEFQWRQIK